MDISNPLPSPQNAFRKPGETLIPYSSDFEGEPLATRGWALQERVLARRLLHFNTRQMYYECDDGGLVGENGTRTARSCALMYQSASSRIQAVTWYQLIAAYGKAQAGPNQDNCQVASYERAGKAMQGSRSPSVRGRLMERQVDRGAGVAGPGRPAAGDML